MGNPVGTEDKGFEVGLKQGVAQERRRIREFVIKCGDKANFNRVNHYFGIKREHHDGLVSAYEDVLRFIDAREGGGS